MDGKAWDASTWLHNESVICNPTVRINGITEQSKNELDWVVKERHSQRDGSAGEGAYRTAEFGVGD